MDETEYRDLYHSVNRLRCCFEKAMLTRRFGCSRLEKINIADREAASCSDPKAQQECQQLISLFRKNAAFALKTAASSGQLPHAKEIKAQCGGILGLDKLLHGTDSDGEELADIYGLLQEAQQQFGELDQIPYSDIVKTITHFEGRKKRRRT